MIALHHLRSSFGKNESDEVKTARRSITSMTGARTEPHKTTGDLVTYPDRCGVPEFTVDDDGKPQEISFWPPAEDAAAPEAAKA